MLLDGVLSGAGSVFAGLVSAGAGTSGFVSGFVSGSLAGAVGVASAGAD